MFDNKYVQPTSALAQAAHEMTRTMMTGFQKVKNEIRTRNQGRIERSEAQTTDECAAVASAMASMLCEAEGIEFAGTPVAPRHYNAVFGRTDEALWVEAMDKEVMKRREMDSKAWLSFRSRSKDTTSESMRTNGKDGKIGLMKSSRQN